MSSENASTVFANVRPFGADPVDLVVTDGVITGHAAAGQGTGTRVVEGGGRIALPTMVDTHIHPDKTAWGQPWVSRRPAAGIAELGRADAELLRTLPAPVEERARGLLAHAAAHGTRAVRAHADVAPDFGLAGLEGVAEARANLAGVLDMQTVAFPQHGVRRAPGTAELLTEAARSGLADFVGGIDPIGFDDDPAGQLDLLFGLAERYGIGIDLHLHDRERAGLDVIADVIDRTRALSLGGRVTISHAFALVDLTEGELDRLGADLAVTGVGLTTVAPAGRTLPVNRLRELGVKVGLGSDGVRDSWSPFGNADMLHRAHLMASSLRARLDDELELGFLAAAEFGADLLGLSAVDLRPGSPADFFLVRGECLAQIVVDVPARDLVVRAGKVIARDGELG
ncbi:cytosine deaminase [Prauserella marina]|uniref:Cytosine/adenosine deaminase n=1 Tax=Prauserella marina TaxID=530584 RepID=A0A222VWK7_9PSEU|nr:amidohydrolase [Prauserella marina]ASR38101.1 cytosine deaminase [Prauserella marina]PWV78741.1 cytosine/adenosine deaminase-related metal-dependent hydrolase [Prauserella marina]SDC92612.1 Cytosine/adenosine deaminase [Prauserella marina]